MSATKSANYIEAVGRRKTSVARVRITPASGKITITINDRPIETYFPTQTLRSTVNEPLKTVDMDGAYNITAKINGGGIASQAEAMSHGLARALAKDKPELRSALKKEKLLTRDARMKERRKFGLKKARKAPQWSKR